jgi:hypothetical protein
VKMEELYRKEASRSDHPERKDLIMKKLDSMKQKMEKKKKKPEPEFKEEDYETVQEEKVVYEEIPIEETEESLRRLIEVEF